MLIVGQGTVRARDLTSYTARDTHEGITIAAEPYDKDQTEKIKTAFGKGDPRESNALPVYLVIFNPTKDALKLEGMSISLEDANGRKFAQIAGIDLEQRMRGSVVVKGNKVKTVRKPASAITEQELLVKMVPPGETIGGFVYFDNAPKSASGSTVFLNGLKWASSGKELLYFEIHAETKP
jgi:hypothetical protein